MIEQKRVQELIEKSKNVSRAFDLTSSDIEHGAVKPSAEEIEKRETEYATLREDALKMARQLYKMINITSSDVEHGAKEFSDEKIKELDEMLNLLQNEFDISLQELDPSIIVEEKIK